jgi:hypothetical protein
LTVQKKKKVGSLLAYRKTTSSDPRPAYRNKCYLSQHIGKQKTESAIMITVICIHLFVMALMWVSFPQNIASACLVAIFLHCLLFFSSSLCLIWQQQDMQTSHFKIAVLWDVTSCGLEGGSNISEESAASIFCPEDGGSRLLQTICGHIPEDHNLNIHHHEVQISQWYLDLTNHARIL